MRDAHGAVDRRPWTSFAGRLGEDRGPIAIPPAPRARWMIAALPLRGVCSRSPMEHAMRQRLSYKMPSPPLCPESRVRFALDQDGGYRSRVDEKTSQVGPSLSPLTSKETSTSASPSLLRNQEKSAAPGSRTTDRRPSSRNSNVRTPAS